ncbi:cytosine permease [Comamonas sp. JC664]|uniref:cytosine permease n=1 Tax=Comamonas sp. JC664 TaxID=2801917 RepID=UPI0036146660
MCIPAYTLPPVWSKAACRRSSGHDGVSGQPDVLVPMLLIGHAGAKYGIPYAVLARASFGTRAPSCLQCCARWWPALVWHPDWFGPDDLYLVG